MKFKLETEIEIDDNELLEIYNEYNYNLEEDLNLEQLLEVSTDEIIEMLVETNWISDEMDWFDHDYKITKINE